MTALTLTETQRGDFQMHVAGCADLKKGARWSARSGREPVTYTGTDLLDAIRTADTDMADWFGMAPYLPEAERYERAWSTAVVEWAPCLAKAIKAAHITFDKETDEPTITTTTPAPRKTRTTPTTDTKETTQMTDTTTLASGHFIDGGQEYKYCPGTPAAPGTAPVQKHSAPITQFNSNKAHADGLARMCKTCRPVYVGYLNATADQRPAAGTPKAKATPAAKTPKAPKATAAPKTPRKGTKAAAAEAARAAVRKDAAKKAAAPRTRKPKAIMPEDPEAASLPGAAVAAAD
jgi:hypothetical protein